MVKEVSDLTEFNEMLNSGKTIFVDFSAEWCGPCKMISPTFESLALQYTSPGVEFIKVDVDAAQEIAKKCEIRAMPTFKVYRDGEKLEDMVGANVDGLKELIAKYIK